MKHLPFTVSILVGLAAVFVGYTGHLSSYPAWLVGVGGSFLLFITVFAWLVFAASERRKGLVLLIVGAGTVLGYLPAHVALSERLKSPDLYSRVTGNMEAVFFIVPSLVAGMAIFHGVRLLAEARKPNSEGSAAPEHAAGPRLNKP